MLYVTFVVCCSQAAEVGVLVECAVARAPGHRGAILYDRLRHGSRSLCKFIINMNLFST